MALSAGADQNQTTSRALNKLHYAMTEIASDIKDVYTESKGNGFDVKALRTIVRMRKQDANEREQAEAILETYMHAMGMI